MTRERYTRVRATFLRYTHAAALFEINDDEVWIPRSLIHGGDDLQLARLAHGDEFSFQLMDWKAKELWL